MITDEKDSRDAAALLSHTIQDKGVACLSVANRSNALNCINKNRSYLTQNKVLIHEKIYSDKRSQIFKMNFLCAAGYR